MDQAEQSDLAEAAAIAATISPDEIAKGLYSRNKRTSWLSALALRQCGPRATGPLLDAYFASNRSPNRRSKELNVSLAVLSSVAVFSVILAVASLLPETARDVVPTIAFVSLYPIIMGRYLLSHDSRPALRALCLLDDKHVLGALIDSLRRPGVMKPDVRDALTRHLPQVAEEDRDLVTPSGLRTLLSVFDHRNEPLCFGIFHTIDVLGDGTCAPRLRHIVKELKARRGSTASEELLIAAEKSLRVVAARISEQQTSRSLLRPAEERPGGADLLRPVRASDHTSTGSLVRAAERPQEQRLDQKGM